MNSESVKKSRSAKQIAWSKELGRRSAELKKAKNERLTKLYSINKKFRDNNEKSRDNNESVDISNTSDNRNINKYVYSSIGILIFGGLLYYSYKYKFNTKNKEINNEKINDKNLDIKPDKSKISNIKPMD